jgi:hypothetical protein
MPISDFRRPLPATNLGPKPGAFPLGSPQSRAAARALLTARAEIAPTERLRILVTPCIGKVDFSIRSTGVEGGRFLRSCSVVRRLGPDGCLSELVHLNGSRHTITDEELEAFINSFPIERGDDRGQTY